MRDKHVTVLYSTLSPEVWRLSDILSFRTSSPQKPRDNFVHNSAIDDLSWAQLFSGS